MALLISGPLGESLHEFEMQVGIIDDFTVSYNTLSKVWYPAVRFHSSRDNSEGSYEEASMEAGAGSCIINKRSSES